MIRLLFGIILATAMIGCTGIQPVGPLAKNGGSAGSANSKLDKDLSPPDPVMIPAPTPTPPKCLVRPEDVNSTNTDFIQQQLKAELEADGKTMPSVPVTAEISEYKNGINTRSP
jgi:hypothetical protein